MVYDASDDEASAPASTTRRSAPVHDQQPIKVEPLPDLPSPPEPTVTAAESASRRVLPAFMCKLLLIPDHNMVMRCFSGKQAARWTRPCGKQRKSAAVHLCGRVSTAATAGASYSASDSATTGACIDIEWSLS